MFPGAATSHVVTGLTNGVTYAFRVAATNAFGTSPANTTAAVTAGGRTGILTLVVDAELGGVLGAQVVGPGAEEIAGLVATCIQAELAVDDVAALGLWHPSAGEAVVDAARQVVTDR